MRELLKNKGFKLTPQRELIFSIFLEQRDHVSVDELYDEIRKLDSSIGYSTVWRNLKLICKLGLAREINVGDGITRYDQVTHGPHGHLFCVKCKKLVEFSVDKIVGFLDQVAEDKNFQIESFKIEIQGLCDDCRALNEKTSV
ncbi:MAG: transcriptional repressor [Candidatus Zixiibacteriota bacterium]|nr:MAG: transcriptional repressor [candidate division Zixibacteria bacterium]